MANIVVASCFFLLGVALSAAYDRDSILLYGEFVEDVYNKSSILTNDATGYMITRNLYATEKTGVFFGEPYVYIGIVAISNSRRNIVVALRGTHNPAEWAKNILVDQVPFTYLNGSTSNAPNVHQGFLSLYNSYESGKTSLRQQIVDELRSLASANPGYSISFVGHSLGGALAILTAFDVANSDIFGKTNEQLSVFTFASPMVGDESFKRVVSASSSLSVLRVWDVRDIVPRLPSLNYVHVGGDLSLDGCALDGSDNGGDVFSKVIMYHSISRYLRSVRALGTKSAGRSQDGSAFKSMDLQNLLDFVKEIVSSVKSGATGFTNLVSAMKEYTEKFSSACDS